MSDLDLSIPTEEVPKPVRRPLLRCEQLVVGYGGKPLLPAIDLEIQGGEFWAVVGRNGSGKSTWFKTLLGLIPEVSGNVQHLGDDLRTSYIAQRMYFDDLYPLTVRRVVSLGTLRGWSFLNPWRGADRGLVKEALGAVNALELENRLFRSLSEGQKQRVLLARMVASRSHIALLDEPTAAIDAVAERAIMDLLDRLRRRYGMAIVVVSHHLAVARKVAEKVLFLDPDDQHAIVGTTDEVFRHPAYVARYGEGGVRVGDC